MTKGTPHRRIPVLKVHQWLAGWNKIEFAPKEHRSKPSPDFYLFSLSAQELRSLSGISRRQASNVTPRGIDLGIQRQHDPERSKEIARFVEFGYPWSTLSEAKRKTEEYNDLRKPGWLPTAIVINILRKADERHKVKVSPDDIITLEDDRDGCNVILPYATWTKSWHPSAMPPLEVIDGQHRLWAFESDSEAEEFEVPVVAFHGLDISWQAYLFWTINIKPKRINASLAFDLYPLLRTENWLDRAEGHPIYRETRSQELTEALWSNSESPWYDRINMLGERQNNWVSQSAWIKTLMATFVRPWEGRRNKMGGLFGSRLAEGGEVLGWSRAQQAAFLLFAWQALYAAIHNTKKPWATNLRTFPERQSGLVPAGDDAAFYGEYSIIASDQGVRGYMHVLNDLCFMLAAKLKLDTWQLEKAVPATDSNAVSAAYKSINKQPVAGFVQELAQSLATFDWRTSATPDLPEPDRRAKLVFRGSSGYKELRIQLLEHLKGHAGDIGNTSKRLLGLV